MRAMRLCAALVLIAWIIWLGEIKQGYVEWHEFERFEDRPEQLLTPQWGCEWIAEALQRERPELLEGKMLRCEPEGSVPAPHTAR
jgi:hypothetical protein